MGRRYRGSFVTANPPSVGATAASGIWTLPQEMQLIAANNWPTQLDSWYNTTTSTSASQFCFATDGTSIYAVSTGYYVSGTTIQLPVIKFDSSGNVVWQKYYGPGGGATYGGVSQTSIELDSNGNVYVGYVWSGTPGLFKLDSNGNVLNHSYNWYLGTSNAYVLRLKGDSSGNMYLTKNYGSYIAIAKLNSSLTPVFSNLYYLNNYNTGGQQTNLGLDSSNNLYVTFNGTNGYAYSPGLAKIDSSGTVQGTPFVWWDTAYTALQKNVGGCAVDSSGNIYVGWVSNGYPYYRIYLSKFNSSLGHVWTKRAVNTFADYNPPNVSIAGNNIFISGYYVNALFDSSGNVLFSRQGDLTRGIAYGPVYVIQSSTAGVGNVFKTPTTAPVTGTYSLGSPTPFAYYSYGPTWDSPTISSSGIGPSSSPLAYNFPSSGYNTGTSSLSFSKTSISAPGSSTPYVYPGTYTWVAPAGVTSVSAVAIGGGGGGGGSGSYVSAGGGGGLAYVNGQSVTPGSSYTVIVGAGGNGGAAGGYGSNGGYSSVFGMTAMGGGANGGSGYPSGTYTAGYYGGTGASSSYYGAGGGGAAGYSGNGGNGGASGGVASTNGSGGGGGGGGGGAGGYYTCSAGGNGGGVGIVGQGPNGIGGAASPLGCCGSGSTGGAGSYGCAWSFGGGGGQGYISWSYCCCYGWCAYYTSGNSGGDGAVRILWGAGRSFPSTNVGAP